VYIYLHGFTGSGHDANLLKDSDNTPRQWATMDWLGHGESSAPACGEFYRLHWQLHALRSHILKLKPGNPVVLVGYSMGGRLALHFALHYPELISKLVLISASPGIKEAEARTKRWRQDYQRSRQILELGINHFCTEWQKLPILQSQQNIPNPYRDALRECRFAQSPVGLANTILHLSPGVLPSLWDSLHRISVSTVLITGSLDLKFTEIAEKMAEQMPQVRHSEVRDTGHTPHLENTGQFLNLLNE
jgi:2-succinyl-6-hydroxy-2,4-cyclohexadiene-1-carboxylate synthase